MNRPVLCSCTYLCPVREFELWWWGMCWIPWGSFGLRRNPWGKPLRWGKPATVHWSFLETPSPISLVQVLVDPSEDPGGKGGYWQHHCCPLPGFDLPSSLPITSPFFLLPTLFCPLPSTDLPEPIGTLQLLATCGSGRPCWMEGHHFVTAIRILTSSKAYTFIKDLTPTLTPSNAIKGLTKTFSLFWMGNVIKKCSLISDKICLGFTIRTPSLYVWG